MGIVASEHITSINSRRGETGEAEANGNKVAVVEAFVL